LFGFSGLFYFSNKCNYSGIMEIYLGKNQKVTARYKGFDIETDQPVKAGGDNEHPSPFDLFLVSIGTCAGLYVKSFCRQRKISDSDIKLRLEKQRNKKTGMIEKIDITVFLPPEFPEKYREAVIKAAKQCAVKKHIFEPPEFTLRAEFYEV